MVAHHLDQADLQDCKFSRAQTQDWHQSETYDKKGDCGEVEGSKDEQAVPTANWNVKSAVLINQGRIAQETQELWHGDLGFPDRALLARVGVDWVGAMWPLVHHLYDEDHGEGKVMISEETRRNAGTYAQTTLLLLRGGCGRAEEHLVPRSRTEAV